MAEQRKKDWHALSTEGVLAIQESDGHNGLSSEEAAHRLREYGPNIVLPRAGPDFLIRLLRQFQNPLITVLIAAGSALLFLPGHLIDAAVVFGVVLINALASFVQESQAQAAIEALAKLVKIETTVIRSGQTRKLNASAVVPGDLVLLQSGDRVPADLRLLRLKELSLDESMLTGESMPVAKELPELPSDTPLADRKNMAYSGTLVFAGQGTGLVVGTGCGTELGRISELIESAEEISTPLTKKLARFSIGLTWAILFLAAATFGAGILRGAPIADTFLAAVALAVAAIPEGLPAAMTIILATGVTRMAKRNAIVRKLPAVETLGSTTIICSDKTGTLTKNEMTVTSILAGGERYEVTGSGYEPKGSLIQNGKAINTENSHALLECLRAGALCNASRLVEHAGEYRIEGDPTEGALLVAALKAGLDPGDLRDRFDTIDSIPFESERQYMATLHRTPENEHVVYLKGATERVLAFCGSMMDNEGKVIPFDQERAFQAFEEMAKEGLRLLAFACKKDQLKQTMLHPGDVEKGMTFLGFQGMIDPPRPEAIAAVRACQGAGIRVKMITGDHALTALTIARQMGIGGENPSAISGPELSRASKTELKGIGSGTDVFARVAPEQKLDLVNALQAMGELVAMTGDGVNDAPALKQADIGIAMGLAGTEVAKEAADMILADDDFASIEAAVEEGRMVTDNLRKFITWTLPTNGGEGVLLISAIMAGLPIPILPVHLLWINMTTSVSLGLMLAFEPKEKGLMERPPSDPNEPILNKELLLRIAYVSLLMVIGAYAIYAWELARGIDLKSARTTVASVVVFVETAYLLNCRSLSRPIWKVGFFSNRWVLIGISIMTALQLAFIYLSPMQELFQSAAIPIETWPNILLVAFSIYLVVEGEKMKSKRKKPG